MRVIAVAFGLAIASSGFAAPAAAQDYVGPAKCINCHDHEDEVAWWEREDGPPPDGHINALRQMENIDSPAYAAAVGLDASLDGVYDLEGSCVTCHATVFKGDANAGISCESCHGPGSDYFDSHQEDNSYRDSLTRGMLDVVGNLQGWVEECVRCHVMDDSRLIAAGHPSGDDFDIAEKFGIVQAHWSNEYNAAEVATAARAVREAILLARAAPPPAASAPAPVVPSPLPAAPRRGAGPGAGCGGARSATGRYPGSAAGREPAVGRARRESSGAPPPRRRARPRRPRRGRPAPIRS